MDVDHLGIALVDQLVDKGIVRDVADLYALTQEQVASLERMGDKSAKNVIASIEGSRGRTLDRVLCGLGIPQIGQVAARQLAEAAGSLRTILAWSPGGAARARRRHSRLRAEDGGERRGVLRGRRSAALMEKLLERGVGLKAQPKEAAVTTGPLVGKSFCVTGVLSRKREDIHAELRAAGARVDDGVKKDTTYLVAGEKTGKAKLDQAKKFGTKVISEAEMEEMLKG